MEDRHVLKKGVIWIVLPGQKIDENMNRFTIGATHDPPEKGFEQGEKEMTNPTNEEIAEELARKLGFQGGAVEEDTLLLAEALHQKEIETIERCAEKAEKSECGCDCSDPDIDEENRIYCGFNIGDEIRALKPKEQLKK